MKLIRYLFSSLFKQTFTWPHNVAAACLCLRECVCRKVFSSFSFLSVEHIVVCVSIGRELCLVWLGCLAGWAGVFFPDTMSRVLLTFL